MCVHGGGYVCVHTHTPVHMEVHGQPWVSFLWFSPPFVLRKVLSLTWSFANYARLTGQQALKDLVSAFYLTISGITGMHHCSGFCLLFVCLSLEGSGHPCFQGKLFPKHHPV